ncbi:MAG: hypothetical protein IPL46_00475 [Saprospiraceae bacterium]|nr:hypothetical protein [Saprospiraceae bacterium]
MKRALAKFFRGRTEVGKAWDIVKWWEIRRVPCNLLIMVIISIDLNVIEKFGDLKAGEDPIEPVSIWAIFIAANFFYCLGWMAESVRPNDLDYGPKLLKWGILFSIALLLLPSLLGVII